MGSLGGSWQAGQARRRLVFWVHSWRGDLLLFLVLGLLFGLQGTQGASQVRMRQLGRVREAQATTTCSAHGSAHTPCGHGEAFGEAAGLSPSTEVLKGKK